MKVFHETHAAKAIHADGFKDASGYYGTGNLYTGVWVSDRPLDVDPDPDRTLFEIEMPPEVFEQWEWVEEGKPYREALVPAEMLNKFPRREVFHPLWHDDVAPDREDGLAWTRRLATARHEAAHGVAHILLELPFEWVEAVSPGSGMVRQYAFENADVDSEFYRKQAIISLAGNASDEFFGTVDPIAWQGHEDSEAMNLALRGAEWTLVDAWKETRVVTNYPRFFVAVDALADRLMKTSRVSYAEAMSIWVGAAKRITIR